MATLASLVETADVWPKLTHGQALSAISRENFLVDQPDANKIQRVINGKYGNSLISF